MKKDKVLINVGTDAPTTGFYKEPRELFGTRRYDYDSNPRSARLFTNRLDLGFAAEVEADTKKKKRK